MAGEEIYIAKIGAMIARALGDTAAFAGDLDTDGLGFQLPDGLAGNAGVQAAAAALADAGGQLSSAANELDGAVASGDSGDLVGALFALVEAIYLFVNAIAALADQVQAAGSGLPNADRAAVEAFAAVMARRVFDAQVISFLAQHFQMVAVILKMLGLIEWEVVEESGALNETRHVRKVIRLDRIKTLMTDPVAHFEDVHGWGTASFDPEELMSSFLFLFHEESPVRVGKRGGDAFFQIGPVIWSRDSSIAPPGLKLDYFKEFVKTLSERAEINDSWGVDFNAEFALGTGFTFRLAPPFDMSIEPKAGTARGAFEVMFNRNPAARGFTIVGGNDLIEIVAEDLAAGGKIEVGASTSGSVDINPGVSADLSGLTLKLGSEGSDNFLASLLAEADIQGVFDLGLGWSLRDGLEVRAAGGLEVAIPMHQDLGFAEFKTLYLILGVTEEGSLTLEASAAIAANLGPLNASVERMGIKAELAFTDDADAALGPFDLGIAFKPPSGVGLSLDAGAVRGGGYLYLDYEKGEYAGAMELVFSGLFAVKAIGIINTRMPDGSDGYSLLIIVTAEFGTPIQLGFGFTLNGLGGLLGLNRTMVLEELAEGVRSGAIEGIMFPQDVVANAPQIISDMRRFFPPEADTFLIGPMAKLGWGTPTLITASLGVIIEVPPGNIAILGVLKCALPDEDAALLVLQVNFIGAIEIDKSRIWFFASLFGSRVLFITLSGEMGLLIAWGDNADFVLSVGGFHPQFTPPPMPFPSPARIALSILDESFARIRVEGYFAVTSNTAQFGARVELFFGIDAFSVEGHIGFDALFQFSPFYFIITFSASLSVKVFGAGVFSVRIRGELEGVSPWHVEGNGSISLLFWDIDVPFSHTWGDNANTILPEIAALPILIAELEKAENWLALAPDARAVPVTLRTVDATAELLLHPMGALRISQRAMPLGLKLDKIGNKAVSDIEDVTFTSAAAGMRVSAAVREPFATGQYRDIDGAAKLSSPGYEHYDAGADLTPDGGAYQTSHGVKREVLHELIVIDSNYREHFQRFWRNTQGWFAGLLTSTATARAHGSQVNRKFKDPFADKISVSQPGFVVAERASNTAADGLTYATQAEAIDAMAVAAGQDAHVAAGLHVIPAVEARLAA